VTPLDPSTFLQVVVPVASAGVAGGAAFGVLRRVQTDDAYAGLGRAFAGVAVSFAVAALSYALLGSLIEESGRLLLFFLFVVAGPWIVFVMRYVGRGHVVTRERVAVGGVGLVVTAYLYAALLFPERLTTPLPAEMLGPVVSFLWLGVVSVTLGIAGVAVVSAHKHDRLSAANGVVAAAPVVVAVVSGRFVSADTPWVNRVVVAAAFVAVATTLVVGPRRYGLVDDPPGVRLRGRRVGLTDAGAAVLVVDEENRVVHTNDAAEAAFGDVERLPEATDAGFETLADRETVSCWTRTGRRRFDPRVTRFHDEFDETLGATVALIDVTDREIRRQRLEVLNRVLRHNVRNQLDVIAAHAETAELPAVVDSVERIRELSAEARRVESLVGRSRSATTPTDLAAFVERVVDETVPDHADAVTVDVPSVTIGLDRELCWYALSELLGNAVEHGCDDPTVAVRGSETATGSRLVVADDGPGIPASEQAVIDAGSETPLSHGSSLGLWGVQWAVQTLGGSLSFEESDLGGTAVTLELPDRGATPTNDAADDRRSGAGRDTPNGQPPHDGEGTAVASSTDGEPETGDGSVAGAEPETSTGE
jgi:signal transduction histidine kinase